MQRSVRAGSYSGARVSLSPRQSCAGLQLFTCSFAIAPFLLISATATCEGISLSRTQSRVQNYRVSRSWGRMQQPVFRTSCRKSSWCKGGRRTLLKADIAPGHPPEIKMKWLSLVPNWKRLHFSEYNLYIIVFVRYRVTMSYRSTVLFTSSGFTCKHVPVQLPNRD